jgi:putative membrane-bound dehydrogenase-like protein
MTRSICLLSTTLLAFACFFSPDLRPGLAASRSADAKKGDSYPERVLKVPEGFSVERVAGPPLVEHPMHGAFDDRGRLFVTEAAGKNLNAEELLKELPNSIKLLEPAGGDGQFHKAAVFAEKMTFPSGVCWLDGKVYSTAYPSVWRMEEEKGVASKREEIVGKFGSIGNGADLHGPVLGPDGRLYFCDGRNKHDIQQPDGYKLKGLAAGVYRCRPDGTQVERICGGGMDNPVEVAFTRAGESLVCTNLVLNSPRHDAILFALDGAVYPYDTRTYPEFQRTGDLMPMTCDLGWVAVSGMIRYRSETFGNEYKDNFFTAQFNPHRIQRHILTRDGAGFRVHSEDFITCDDPDFHPIGLIEDADGSLLVIDTGGWFRNGCPASQVAKPQQLGGIYRVRRKDASVVDPRGRALDWDKADAEELAGRLADARFGVRDRAIHELAKKGKVAVPPLAALLAEGKGTPNTRLEALWALTRIEDTDARKAIRAALADPDLDVRLAAISSVGLYRDADAMPALMKLIENEDPTIRRQTATTLGRLGNARAVPDLLNALRGVKDDRWLEHALIYALIQIADANATRPGLHSDSPAVQRGALIALDQIEHGKLTREEVAPLLSSADPATAKAALEVLKSNPAWAKETLGLLRQWLEAGELDSAHQELLRGTLTAFAAEPDVQDLVALTLRRDKTSPALRLLLLETIARMPLDWLPSTWKAELRWCLDSSDEKIVRQAIACMRAGKVAEYYGPLLRIGNDAKRPEDLRVASLAIALPQVGHVDKAVFDFLTGCLNGEKPPLVRLAAADALAQAPLNFDQLKALTARVGEAGPLEISPLAAAFERSSDVRIGRALIAALDHAPGLPALSPGALRSAFRNYPEDVRREAEGLLSKVDVDADKQKAHLTELQPLLESGDEERGRIVFFNSRTACSACHTVGKQGGHIGPELTKIGSIRAPNDLLESVIYPSATIVRGYESYVVETTRGVSYTGLLSRETPEAIYLTTTDRTEIRIPRTTIELIKPSRQSIMPQGLENQMSRQELRDLLAFLRSLK